MFVWQASLWVLALSLYIQIKKKTLQVKNISSMTRYLNWLSIVADEPDRLFNITSDVKIFCDIVTARYIRKRNVCNSSPFEVGNSITYLKK